MDTMNTDAPTNRTAAELRADAARADQEAHDSFERCDTDGFLTQWASGLTAQLKRRQADIQDRGGLAEFPALFRLDGTYQPARLVDGQYGTSWMLLDDSGRSTGQFIGFAPKRATTLTRKGFTEGRVLRPAVAFMDGRGRGLSGSAWVATRPTDSPTDQPHTILYTDRFAQ